MAAILQSVGPVTGHRVIARNYKFLRLLTVKQFLMAANDLQAADMGMLVTIDSGKGHGRTQLFVKKPPEEMEPYLDANPNLCSVEYYRERYYKPVSKSITLIERHYLSKMGAVTASQMM